jgi:hypothetical protein
MVGWATSRSLAESWRIASLYGARGIDRSLGGRWIFLYRACCSFPEPCSASATLSRRREEGLAEAIALDRWIAVSAQKRSALGITLATRAVVLLAPAVEAVCNIADPIRPCCLPVRSRAAKVARPRKRVRHWTLAAFAKCLD